MITRYDPFREALSLRRAMDQLFEQSFVNPRLMPGSSSLTIPMDICETQNGYEVDVALPGVRPEDIDLVVDQNTLTIRGHYSQQNEHQNQGEQQAQTGQAQQQGQPQTQQQGQAQTRQGRKERHQSGHAWLAREIVSGSFERSVTFPKPIDTDKIQTSFQNGILTIQIPESEASRPKRISVRGGQPQQATVEAEKH
jgi:HSP20 family protein